MCAAVILAAGEAERMGVAKPAMPYGDTTLVGSVVTKAHKAGLDPVVVVTGFHGDEVAEAVGDSAEIARNPDPGRGNMSSLLVGLDAVGDVDAVVVLLSDMPGVEVTDIAAVRDCMRATGARFAWARYHDGRGHPVAMSAAGCSEIVGLTGTKALWPFFDRLDAGSYCEVKVDGPRPLDVNSPADYRALTGDNGDILGA